MVQAGTLFDYLTAFITIVLALALSDLALSLHRLIRARRTVRWHPLPLIAALWVLLVLLTNFFGLWSLTELSAVTYYQLFWFVLPQLCYFLAASAVLPDEIHPEFDLVEFYFAERRYIFAVLAAGFVLEFADDLLREGAALMAAPPILAVRYFAINAVTLAAFAAMWISPRRSVHWAGFAVLFVAAQLGFFGWEITGAPALDAPVGAASPGGR